MSGLLIYTTGDTDVQLVENGQRWELRKVAKELVAPTRSIRLVPSNLPKARCEPRTNLPDGDLEVCTPKADAVLAHLEEHAPDLRQVLLLHTDRPNDPVHATRFVQERLEQADLTVEPVSFLSEGPLEGPLDGPFGWQPEDAVIRRVVSQRLEQVVSTALENTSGPLIVAAIGGVPSVRALVTELVRLHAGARKIHELDVVDRSKSSPSRSRDLASPPAFAEATPRAAEATHQDRAIERRRLDPTELVAARRHALTLVERGNFVAAWGAVAHLEHEPSCQPWVQVIKTLFLWACSLPMDAGHGLPLPSLEQRAASAALRTEAALRCEDWPRAILGTYATFEAAVWDQLYQHHIAGTHHHEGKRLFRLRHAPPASWLGPDGDKPRHAPIKLQLTAADGISYYGIECYSDKASKILKDHLKQATPNTCAALLALAQPISQTSGARNVVAHGEPNRDNLEAAKLAFTRQRLWTRSRTASAPTGTLRFTASPLIVAALSELGVDSPESLFERLIDAVRERLLALDPLPTA